MPLFPSLLLTLPQPRPSSPSLARARPRSPAALRRVRRVRCRGWGMAGRRVQAQCARRPSPSIGPRRSSPRPPRHTRRRARRRRRRRRPPRAIAPYSAHLRQALRPLRHLRHIGWPLPNHPQAPRPSHSAAASRGAARAAERVAAPWPAERVAERTSLRWLRDMWPSRRGVV